MVQDFAAWPLSGRSDEQGGERQAPRQSRNARSKRGAEVKRDLPSRQKDVLAGRQWWFHCMALIVGLAMLVSGAWMDDPAHVVASESPAHIVEREIVEREEAEISAVTAVLEEQSQKEWMEAQELYGFYDMLQTARPLDFSVFSDEVRVEEGVDNSHRRYILQAASFSEVSDAQRLVRQLGAMGLSASVQSGVTQEGRRWSRVMVGPFDSKSRVNKAKDVLVSLNMMPMVRFY